MSNIIDLLVLESTSQSSFTKQDLRDGFIRKKLMKYLNISRQFFMLFLFVKTQMCLVQENKIKLNNTLWIQIITQSKGKILSHLVTKLKAFWRDAHN